LAIVAGLWRSPWVIESPPLSIAGPASARSCGRFRVVGGNGRGLALGRPARWTCSRDFKPAVERSSAVAPPRKTSVLAQRFRVYQRKGYYRPGLRVDRDRWDDNAVHFLALLRNEQGGGVLLGSARLIVGESVPGFRFPTEENFDLELPAAMQETALSERAEISRLVGESTHGIVIGGLLTPLGLLQALVEYGQPRGIRCGLAMIKQRLLRALQSAGVCVDEIEPAKLVSPENGPMSGYLYRHADPVIPTYWLTDEVVPSIAHAIMRYQGA
jgi:hypothetical protein